MSKLKTYWKGIEEREQDSMFMESTQQEFPQHLPTNEFLANDKIAQSSTGRRDFLKFMGFSVAAATLAACEAPVIKSIPYVNKPEEITPGIANWYASTYWDGSDYASILIKTREGRPIFIKGNKDFGVNQGSTTPRIVGSVLSLYNGARLKNPIIKGAETTWSVVDTEIKGKLKAIKEKGGKVRILTNTVASPSTENILNEFVRNLTGVSPVMSEAGNNKENNETLPQSIKGVDAKVIAYDAISNSGMLKANSKNYGKIGVPDYHFDKAKVIVSVNADFMTNWLLSTDYLPDYLINRNPENGWMSRHFQFESVLTTTGSNADVRIPIKPSEEGLVVAALYNQIVGKLPGVQVPAAILNATTKVASELKANKGKSLLIAGTNCEGVQTVVSAINEALGNVGTTIDMNNLVSVTSGFDDEVEKLTKELEAGEIDALIMYNVNPVYTLPNGDKFAEALKKVGLTVSFSQYADETASKCEFICPDHHFTEGWNDYQIKQDHYAVAQPVIRPLYNTASAQESLLVWMDAARRGGKDSTVYHDYIKSSFMGDWNQLVHDGSMNYSRMLLEISTAFEGDLENAGKFIAKGAQNTGKYEVVLYKKNGIGDGQQAANPWLQELPDPITKVTWDNYITISQEDAKTEGFNILLGEKRPASVATVTVNEVSLTLPVFVLPGQKSGTLGIAYGYGRGAGQENIGDSAYQTQEYGTHIIDPKGNKQLIGANAFRLTSYQEGVLAAGGAAILMNKKGETYPLACTQTHHTFMGRTSIIRETTFDTYKNEGKDAYNEDHTLVAHEKGKTVHKHISEFDLWEKHPVENIGHRWGLSIDLNTCIGCGTCIIACHTENNVPVVGKDEIRRGRDMHWLRIDRYFSSAEDKAKANYEENHEGTFSYDKLEIPEDNPKVVHLPVMCQHCNHAPCETVCPVVATTHSNEGLNQMTYNRCIGTRYCANNCPYKVRRFNWFNYPTNDRFVHFNPAQMDMGRMVLNPDVTVRTRGVMEKCSMCVQRIQEGKLEAKKVGKPIVDGAIQTACSSSCPTDAITFGDLNDFKSHDGKGSVVRQKADHKRSYIMLEEVGTQPNVYYQVKVRNVTKEEA